MSTQLNVEGIVKAYDKKVVLNGISFAAEKGEFIVLVGPSGCGKSTMLRAIAGLEMVDGGSISIAGHNVTDRVPKDRNIAMVFQDYALYPHKTVYENIAFGLRIQKLEEADIHQRVQAAAQKLDLLPLLQRRPAALSGGQRQRVAIGRAIVRNPAVFLFDEPLSNLDAKLRGSMRLTISRLHKDLAATIVYVTHDQVEAMTLADQIIVLEGGEIQQMGPPLRLYYHPVNIFVATFIGSPPMNLISGHLNTRDGKIGFSAESGLDFRFPEELRDQIIGDDLEGKAVFWGARSENFSFAESGTEGVVLKAEVLVTEPLGPSTSVLCSVYGHEVLVSLPEPHRPSPGDLIHLKWDSTHLYLFDHKSQKTLVRKSSSF